MAANSKKIDRDALCRELLKLHKKHAVDFARLDEIKSLLKADANGDNYKITVAGLGVVKVSAPKSERCIGRAPEIVVDAFLALPQREREDLAKRGVVVDAELWKGAYYGSVTAELF